MQNLWRILLFGTHAPQQLTDISLSGVLCADTEPDDVFLSQGSWHHVEAPWGVDRRQQLLVHAVRCVQSAETNEITNINLSLLILLSFQWFFLCAKQYHTCRYICMLNL